MDYGFVHNGKVLTPNRTDVALSENDARNKKLNQDELETWATKPDNFYCYVKSDVNMVTTWMGTTLGAILKSSIHRNNLGAKIESITVRGTNGATYHGRYGCGAGDFCRLRKSKGK